MDEKKKAELEKQGYRFAGNHSAVKVCLWTKKALRREDVCYKQKFYGIKCWQCVQMSTALDVCTHRCLWCWRDIAWTKPKWNGEADNPRLIIDSCIKEQQKYLQGFLGSKKTDKVRFREAMRPKHFAISLISESTFYPKLPEFINELHSRGLTSFLVTNGTNPEMLKKLFKNELTHPTQLYITLPAPNKGIYQKACNPLINNGWKKINESLKLLEKFDTRKAIRLTLTKGLNMVNPEEYAEILDKTKADFFELKAYMHVGFSRDRLKQENMPAHEEIMEFAKRISENSNLKIIDEKPESRVTLMMKKDKKDRIMNFS